MAFRSSHRGPRSFAAAIVAALTLGSSMLGAGIAAPSALAGTKGDTVGPVEVSGSVRSDVSAPVRDLSGAAPSMSSDMAKKDKPLRPLPNRGNALNQPDGVLQASASAPSQPTAGIGFAGVGNGDYGFAPNAAPPDTNGAVGATQYVQWVNESFAVFNKSTGAIVAGFPKAGNSIWSGFGGGCQANNDGDPIVQYDKLANRWILTQFSVTTTPYLECVAVSTTSDATGTYNRYAFSYGTQFNDYPKLGVWPDGYYVSYNIFNGNTFAGSKVCALDRSAMLAGQAATQQCFQLSTSYGGLLPSDLDGTTPPPAGSPNYFMNFGANSLNLWKFHVDFANSANTTFTGPTNIPVAAFSAACGGGGTCIPQAGTKQRLDSLADRLMYRLAYRNFGDHEALVVNHSVAAGSSVGVRWYEVRSPNATPTVFQQGTYAPDATYRWMGSIAMDKAGDIALGYSGSSSTLHPFIAYAGRTAGDALGTLSAETIVKQGGGSQSGSGLSRWGDYSAMSVDPVDDCTFWYTNEYEKTTGAFNWSTWIASFKFPGCGASVANDFSIGANPTSLSLAPNTQGTSTISTAVTSGAAQTVSLSLTGLPTGAAASFSPTSVTAGASSTLTVNAGTAAPGTYTLSVTGTGTSATHSTSISLTVTGAAGAPGAPTLSATRGRLPGILLTWSVPASNGSPISVYNIYRSTTSGAETFLTSAAASSTSYRDTTTVSGRTYFYKITAVNASGEGPFSNEASAKAR
ncbi:MAG: hypothetical protein HY262_08840 [Chloroflexi bacterium]|nr:hypothetical protein [Chloroflexota bacterium]